MRSHSKPIWRRGLIGVFVAVNWTLLTTPIEINFLITTVRVPGAAPCLALIGLILLIDWSLDAINQSAWNRERRSLNREIEHFRAQDREAEASQIRGLQELIERESASIAHSLLSCGRSLWFVNEFRWGESGNDRRRQRGGMIADHPEISTGPMYFSRTPATRDWFSRRRTSTRLHASRSGRREAR